MEAQLAACKRESVHLMVVTSSGGSQRTSESFATQFRREKPVSHMSCYAVLRRQKGRFHNLRYLRGSESIGLAFTTEHCPQYHLRIQTVILVKLTSVLTL